VLRNQTESQAEHRRSEEESESQRKVVGRIVEDDRRSLGGGALEMSLLLGWQNSKFEFLPPTVKLHLSSTLKFILN